MKVKLKQCETIAELSDWMSPKSRESWALRLILQQSIAPFRIRFFSGVYL